MTDLTLYEYQGFSEEKLGQILRTEAKNMFDSHCHENDFGEAPNDLETPLRKKHQPTHLISPYWAIFTDFSFSNIQKILTNLARCFS